MNTDQPNRRTLLRAAACLTAGLTTKALPDTWTRPIVRSVLLPVHAQATVSPDGPTPTEFGTPFLITDAGIPRGEPGVGSIASSARRLLKGWVEPAQAMAIDRMIFVRRSEGSMEHVDVRITVAFVDDVSLYETHRIPLGESQVLHYLGNSGHCFDGEDVDVFEVRVDSVDDVARGTVSDEGGESNFTAEPGAWPPAPGVMWCPPSAECDVEETTCQIVSP